MPLPRVCHRPTASSCSAACGVCCAYHMPYSTSEILTCGLHVSRQDHPVASDELHRFSIVPPSERLAAAESAQVCPLVVYQRASTLFWMTGSLRIPTMAYMLSCCAAKQRTPRHSYVNMKRVQLLACFTATVGSERAHKDGTIQHKSNSSFSDVSRPPWGNLCFKTAPRPP
ncbi:hypothetical protein PsYK624_065020 [Phanerochaete sordida]|uniref:Uncharacterized protein n=1 Tax=Phanerochaete sordida TaxID=48140 RepID=A0A9P3LCC6_9APHY|nr:hypothetical protein PsYK624_065020 [Phanerochaete sordida]